jgi:hypothetical protein
VLITVGLLGLLATLDPLRPVVFLLVLRTERARANGIYFLVGWALALAVLFTTGYLAFNARGSGRSSSAQKTWLSALEVLLAVSLLVMAIRRWLQRNKVAARPATPKAVLRQLEHLDPKRASLLGVLIQPRSLTIAAAVVVARDRSSLISYLGGLGIFALLSTVPLIGLFTHYVRRPDIAKSQYGSLAARIEQAGPTILTVVCALGGGYLLVDGIGGLISR